ncbi:hypothetical protein Ga0123461_1290 [Mariprofundus aestuarium]|uniref:NLI interacting factor-like phosphatase n=1 Tax=Mariprofundus aestuarium TaxID=1921086 RepID=A0A2K8KXP6_MARES|nr:hypothetical protein [Mariprofundus aestuarium]ATX79708.1 hypothetical protein Ga0123461_1290 [Mariprofundus aestuarium]
MKLFLDIDGVLIGKHNSRPVVARGVTPFLEFVTANFDCYWLTTHCQGNVETVIRYLTPFFSADQLDLIGKIKPTSFKTLKTEALPNEKDFIWIEDQLLWCERKFIEDTGLTDNWYFVNTDKDEDGLINLLSVLKNVRKPRAAKP